MLEEGKNKRRVISVTIPHVGSCMVADGETVLGLHCQYHAAWHWDWEGKGDPQGQRCLAISETSMQVSAFKQKKTQIQTASAFRPGF